MKRYYDLAESGFDFAFYSNNIQFHLQKTGTKETLATNVVACEAALGILGQMWCSERFFVQVAPLDAWFPEEEAQTFSIELKEPVDNLGKLVSGHISEWIKTQIQSENQRSWGLLNLESDIFGWNRLVLPPDVALEAPLLIASADMIGPQKYTLLPAQPFKGLRTVWLKLNDVSSETHINVRVQSLNHLEISCILGLGLLNKQYETRDPSMLVHNKSLSEWYSFNQALLNTSLENLHKLGWQYGKI